MLRNYFKTAIRSFARQKGYTLINIAGLTVGIVASLLILLWIQDEVNKDKFHKYDAQLFQVMRFMYLDDGEIITTPSIPMPLAQKLEEDYPEVDHAVLLSWGQEKLFELDDKFTREIGRYAGPTFFEIMSYPLIIGDTKTALTDTYSVVISEKVAIKYFGDEWRSNLNLIGSSLKIDNGELFKITGVFKDVGSNSSLQFDFVLPIEEFNKRNSWVEDWGNNGLRMIVKLKDGNIDRTGFDARLLAEINSHDIGYDAQAFLQPYSERYLYSNYEDGKLIGGRIDYVQIFLMVAIFILIIASINFMNLATARSTLRAKEIGVRKVLGAQRGTLSAQFMIESILMTLVATVISVTLVYLLLPAFNLLTDKQLILDFTSFKFWTITGAITLFTGLLSGSYPALFLSSFKILNVLKGTLKHTRGATYFRKGLVVFQFSLSILLIIGTLTVYRQINYIMTKNVGLNKENVLFMDLEGAMEDHYETFKNELLAVPEVKYVTRSSQNPLSAGSDTFSVHWEGQDPESRILFNIISADYDWIETMGVKLIAGRGYSNDFPFDSASYIINEKSAEIMGMDDPVGQPLTVWQLPGSIVGVVKNFHMSSMYQDMNALVMRFDPGSAGINFIRIEGDVPSAIAGIKAVNSKLNPGFPFDYEFMKDSYEEDYKSELVIGTLANYFAGMAIFISSLGLLGLASFTVGQRTKEIGIRKVLGASVPGLVMMLSKDFTRLIIIAFVIAAPVAYYYSGQWLDKFVYRINTDATVFVVAGVGAFLVASLTVGVKSAQAAIASTANSLKDE
jgi:putative ABC transport system permease protein